MLADFDGDGDLDVAVGNDRTRSLIFFNDGMGRFEAGATFGIPSSTRSLTLADLDGDGHVDILVVNRARQNFIFHGDGSGAFGKGTPFGAKSGGPRFRDILDGTSNTILAVEAGPDKADIWTKPGGIPFDPKKSPIKALGKIQEGGFLTLFMDGRVRFISRSIAEGVLKLLIQHQDGMAPGEF